MNSIPPPPNTGEPMSAAWGRRVVESLRALLPVAGPGIRVSYTARGAIIEAVSSPGGRGSSSGSESPVFEPIIASDQNGARVAVRPGTVNGYFATVAGSPNTGLEEAPPSIAISEDGFLHVKATFTGDEPKTVSGADIQFSTEEHPDDGTDFAWHPICSVKFNGGALKFARVATNALAVCRQSTTTSCVYLWGGV